MDFKRIEQHNHIFNRLFPFAEVNKKFMLREWGEKKTNSGVTTNLCHSPLVPSAWNGKTIRVTNFNESEMCLFLKHHFSYWYCIYTQIQDEVCPPSQFGELSLWVPVIICLYANYHRHGLFQSQYVEICPLLPCVQGVKGMTVWGRQGLQGEKLGGWGQRSRGLPDCRFFFPCEVVEGNKFKANLLYLEFYTWKIIVNL